MSDFSTSTERWSARPVRARLLRAFILFAPISASIGFVHLASRLVPAPTGALPLFILWWVLLSAAGTGVLILIDRLGRRLLPLVTLLKLSLVFPDGAPSRFRTAMARGTVAALARRIDAARRGAETDTPAEAAEQLLQLVAALDVHDRVTRGHSERVRAYSQMIAEELRLDRRERDLLNWAALLHDVGKLKIPARVLNKPGALSGDERQLINTHPQLGDSLVEPIRSWLGGWADAVGQHHEHWDGTGYPRGVAGNEIGLGARIVAVSDVFDVITSARSYKSACRAEEARAEIARCAGTQFDPRVVRAFLNLSIGRLRLAMGPLSWLAHAPILGRIPLTPALGTASAALASIAAVAATGLAANPQPKPVVPSEATSARSGRPAHVERSLVASRPVRSAAPGGSVIKRPVVQRSVVEPVSKVVPATIAVDDHAVTDEDAPIVVDVLANDRTADGELLHVAAVGAADFGTTTSDGAAVTYVPPRDFNGAARFTYRSVSDGGGESVGTVTVSVRPMNDAPVASEDEVVVLEDAPGRVEVLRNDSDRDGDRLELVSVEGTPAGEAQIVEGAVRFVPARAFTGSTSLSYVVADPDGATARASIAVTVLAVNSAPSFEDGPGVRVLEDAGPQAISGWAYAVTPGPRDEADQSVTFDTSSSNPSLFAKTPSVSSGGTLTFTPAPQANGSAVVTVRAVDDGGTANGGADTSEPRTFTIEVEPVNDVPTFTAGADQAAAEDSGAQAVSSWAKDLRSGPANEAGQAVSFVVSSSNPSLFAAAAGRPAVTVDGTLTYTPAAGASGTSTVTVQAVDDGGTGNGGVDTSPPQTFTITIAAVNDAPIAAADAVATVEDGGGVTFDVLANDTDAEGDALVVTSFDAPTMTGALTRGPGGSFTYVPDPDFARIELFTYTVSDGNGGVSSATVTIDVNPVNDAPLAGADTPTTTEDSAATPFDVLANDTDVDGDPLTVITHDASAVAHGTLTHAGAGTFVYLPDPGFAGSESFTYLVSDGHGGTDVGTATIVVTAVNDEPVAADDTASTAEDSGGVTFDVLANDTDIEGNALAVVSFDPSSITVGTLTHGAGGSFTYVPHANRFGTETFTYTISDGNGGFDTGTVAITVTPVNDAPVAVDDATSTNEDSAGVTFDVLANDADIDGHTLSLLAYDSSTVTHGTLTANGSGSFTYTPESDFFGTESFTYTVGDGNGGSATAAVTVTVTAQPDAPVATADAPTTTEDSAAVTFDVLANDTDPENDPLSVPSFDASSVTAGTLVHNGAGSFTYVPAADWVGSQHFTYVVSDGNGGSDSGTVTIAVTAVNDAPVAVDDTASTNEDSAGVTFDVLANDTDVENDGLSLTAFDSSAVTSGALTHNAAGSFTYVPAPHDSGTVSFTYTVGDGNGGSDTGSVTIAIVPQPDNPAASDDAHTTPDSTALTVAAPGLLANDWDEDGDVLAVLTTPVSAPAHGSLVLNANGSFTYTPDPGYSGTDAFTYRVDDSTGRTADAVATITISSSIGGTGLYLGSTGSSADSWTMSLVPPPAVSPVPDYDGDGEQGLTIESSGGGASESDGRKYQDWAYVVPAPLVLNGPVTLELYSAVERFDIGRDVDAHVYVYDCAAGGTLCTKIAETDVHVNDWDGGVANWVRHDIVVGSVSRTIAAGRELRIKLLFGHEDLWVALTAAHPTALRLTTG